jgi:hypothetical protein
MSWMTIGLLILGGLSAIFLIIGYALPAEWKVEASVDIRGDQREIYAFVAQIRNWERWTVWNRTSHAQYEFNYSGPVSGKGGRQVWQLKGRGGSLEITDAQEPVSIGYQLYMGRGNHPMQGALTFSQVDDCVRVVWTSRGENKQNPAGRILMRLFQPYMLDDFRQSLARLKEIMQGG